MIYINKEQLRTLLNNPKFVAYAQVPNGKIGGGILNGERYQLKRGANEIS